MNTYLKWLFLIFAVVTFIFGAPLLLAPGRFLDIFGWAPVDPLLSRLLGSALLALSWGALRGFRSAERAQARLLIEANTAFCTLGAVGFLRHLATSYYYPPAVWLVFGLLAIFAMAWTWALVKK